MRRVFITMVVSFGALLGVLGLAASPALAESPWWHLVLSARPTNLPPEGVGYLVATVANLGNGSTTAVNAKVNRPRCGSLTSSPRG